MSYEALKKRHDQGWVKEIFDDVEKLLKRVKEAKKKQEVRFDWGQGENQGWFNSGKSSGFARYYFIFHLILNILNPILFVLDFSAGKVTS